MKPRNTSTPKTLGTKPAKEKQPKRFSARRYEFERREIAAIRGDLRRSGIM